MSTLIIPMEDAPDLGNFSLVASLDGVDYQFVFNYNGREDAWYFDLLTVEGNVIRAGVKVVSNWPLLRRCKEETKPGGELMAIDTLSDARDPLLDDLGNRVAFAYVQAEDLP